MILKKQFEVTAKICNKLDETKTPVTMSMMVLASSSEEASNIYQESFSEQYDIIEISSIENSF